MNKKSESMNINVEHSIMNSNVPSINSLRQEYFCGRHRMSKEQKEKEQKRLKHNNCLKLEDYQKILHNLHPEVLKSVDLASKFVEESNESLTGVIR